MKQHAPVGHETDAPPNSGRQFPTLMEETVRSALSVADGPSDATCETLLGAVRRLCAEAHARDVRAEQVLIALKDAWHHSPEVHALELLRADDRLSEVITLCIREFYNC